MRPHYALYRPDVRKAMVWTPDDRRLLLQTQQQIEAAIRLCPKQPRDGSQERRPSAPSLPLVVSLDRPRSPLAKAQELLAVLLDAEATRTTEIRRAASDAGVSWAAVRRAADMLGVVVTRQAFGADGHWYWRLKGAHE